GCGPEQAFERVLDVAGGEDASAAEMYPMAEREGEAPAVRAHLPRLGELGHDVRPVVVVDERVEEHLLESPGARVVADGRVEGVHVLGGAEPERAARPRGLVRTGGRSR